MPPGSDNLLIELDIEVNKDNLREVDAEMAKVLQGIGGGKDKDLFTRMASSFDKMRQMLAESARSVAAINQSWMTTTQAMQRQAQAVAQITASLGQNQAGGGGAAGPPPPGPGGSGAAAGGGGGNGYTYSPNGQPGSGNAYQSSRTPRAFVGAINGFQNMLDQGFSDGSLLRGVGTLAGATGPWGQVAQAAFNVAGRVSDKTDEVREQMYQMFRLGGMNERNNFGGLFEHYGNTPYDKMGLTRQEVLGLGSNMLRQTGNTRDLLSLAQIEGGYGLGNEGAGLLGQYRRAGATEAGRRELQDTIAVAMATGLDKSRTGEVFTMLGMLASGRGSGVVNTAQTAQMAQFIGTAGPQYQGATQQAGNMAGMMQQMAAGAGGPGSEFFALQAAGLGQPGVSYADAKMRISRGLGHVGGIDPQQLVQTYADIPGVREAFTKGTEQDKNKAAFLIAQMAGVDQGTVYDMLSNYFKNSMPAVDTNAGSRAIAAEQPMEADLSRRRAQNRSDQVYRWLSPSNLNGGNFLGTPEERKKVIEGMMNMTIGLPTGLPPLSIEAPGASGGAPKAPGALNLRGASISNPAMLSALQSAAAAYQKETGKTFGLSGSEQAGDRSESERQKNFAAAVMKYGPIEAGLHAARRHSFHQDGMAVDVGDAEADWLAKHPEFGLRYPGERLKGRDRHHFELGDVVAKMNANRASQERQSRAEAAVTPTEQPAASIPGQASPDEVFNRLDIWVHDNRVSVTKSAGSRGPKGTGLYGRKG